MDSFLPLEFRMYFLVPYNISPIQQGIQALHAAIEYSGRNFKSKEYQTWAGRDKTVIILNGGTTNTRFDEEAGKHQGSLNQALNDLANAKVVHNCFFEPDLNDALTGIAFLVDERVYDHKKYVLPEYPQSEGVFTVFPVIPMPIPQEKIDAYDAEVLRVLGNKQNVFLREFLKGFRLA